MPYTKSAQKNFEEIWKDLLKIKIKIIFNLSIQTNKNFIDLLENELPEAFEYKEIWEKDYS